MRTINGSLDWPPSDTYTPQRGDTYISCMDGLFSVHDGESWSSFAGNKFVLDLSPLASFLKGTEGATWDSVREQIRVLRENMEANGYWTRRPLIFNMIKPSKMYGIDSIPDLTNHATPKEVDPIQREIDKMMERRKAKRIAIPPEVWEAAERENEAEHEQGKALERVFGQLTHWEKPFTDRLNPYRGPNL